MNECAQTVVGAPLVAAVLRRRDTMEELLVLAYTTIK